MFAAAATGLGLPLLVTVRLQAIRTFVTTVVLLLLEVGSVVPEEETEEFAVIVATDTVGARFTTTMMFADAPAATLGLVQVTAAVHVQPGGAEADTKVVLAGIASVKLTVDAAAGPLFVTVCVYVMLLPAITVGGVATVVSARSACPPDATTSVAVAEFGPNPWFPALTAAVSVMIVPLGVTALTVYSTVKVPVEPAATLGLEQGVAGNPAQVQPAGGATEKNAVLAGVASLNDAPVAAIDPVFVTTCV